MAIAELIRRLPKAELHLHIEGTLEPELMLRLAERNGVALPYRDVDEIRAAYDFKDLQSFLDIYYAGAQVLQTERDFRDLTLAFVKDPALVERLAQEQVPLTVCPLSNVKLRVFDTLEQHNLGRLLEAGLCATVNSDDPAYFGGYVGENFLRTQKALGLTAEEIALLARNSFTASFLPPGEKERHVAAVDGVLGEWRAGRSS